MAENTIIIRELSPVRDFAALLSLTHAIERDKGSTELTTQAWLEQSFQFPRSQRWVAEMVSDPQDDSRNLVGSAFLFAQIKERSSLDLSVHPQWRGKGIGRQLLLRLLDEAGKLGADWANFEIDEKNQDGIAFLRHFGFEPCSDTWMMRAPADAAFAAPVWPPDYSVRSYAEVGDLNLLVQACNRSFGDVWGHNENTQGGVTAETVARWSKNWDPHGVFLVFAPDGSPAGYCRADSGAQTGESEDLLDQPGITPEHRALNLQRPLALTVAHWLRSQGTRPIRLESWGDSAETAELYRGLGFELVEHDIALRKRLDGGSE